MNQIASIKKEQLGLLPGLLLALAAAVLLFAMPSASAQGCADGVQLCLNTAIPSLFPMMFATILATETGLTQWLGRLLSPVTRWLFGLSGEAGGALVMALIGGFPAGAKAVSGLYERGAVSGEEAERMYLFCFAAGPAFLIGAVGGLYADASVGAVLLGIQIISVILIGVLSRFLIKSDGREKTAVHKQPDIKVGISAAVTRSAAQTASAMLNICLFIILFSVLRAILDSSGISSAAAGFLTGIGMNRATAETVIPVMLEVTSGCVLASECGLPMTAFAVGFGGLSVHMQVLAIAAPAGVRYSRFLAARLLQGMLCAIMMKLYLLIAPQTAVTASAAVNSIAISTTPAGAVILVVMSFMLLVCLPRAER